MSYISLIEFYLNKIIEKFCQTLDCAGSNECEIEMPTAENSKLEFTKYRNQLQIPFIVYADIETMLKGADTKYGHSDNVKIYQLHQPYSIVSMSC